jgi:hypothetical protein
MKRIIIIVIAAAIIALIVLLIFYRPNRLPNPSAPELSTGVAVTTPSRSTLTVPPTPTIGLSLTKEQSAKLGPMFKDEDEKIQKIANNSTLTPEQKSTEIRKVREADRIAEQKILSPEQYKRLVMTQADHDGAVLAAAQ